MRQVMTNPHFVPIVSRVGRSWHSPAWQRRHPTIDLKAHFDGLHHLLQHAVFAQTASVQTFSASLLELLDTLEAADLRLSARAADRAWLLAITSSRRALTVMLMILTSIYSPPAYYTPEQPAAQGTGSVEEWRQRASHVPGAFQAGGRWWLPFIGLRAIGIPVDPYPQHRMVDPDAQERPEAGSS
jgi:hypothetical protein